MTSSCILTIECGDPQVREIVRVYLENIDNAGIGVRTTWIEEDNVEIKREYEDEQPD